MEMFSKISYWVKMEFGDTFFRIQKFLFSMFIIGEITGAIIQGIANGNTRTEIFILLMKIFEIWIITVFILVILWVFGKRVADLDLLFEYYLWIPHVVPRIGKLFRLYPDDQLELLELVRKSYSYEKRGGKPCPVFIKRAHLERKRFWPHWEFSIVVINQPGKIKIIVRNSESHMREKRWEMIVNLLDESFGIYNNAGKRFLRENFYNAHIHESMAQASKKCYEILDPHAELGISFSWGDTNERLPLRWASGGFLPIIEYRQKEWAMFFFRDILPIGLNIANGASEKKDEYKELHRLIGREFAEEVILLTGIPYSGSNISQQRFTQDEFNPNLQQNFC